MDRLDKLIILMIFYFAFTGISTTAITYHLNKIEKQIHSLKGIEQ